MPGKRILIEIGHPAHVHHFKHMYWDLEKMGWTGLFVTKDKECAIDLLKAYKLPYRILGTNKKGVARKILSLPYFTLKMLSIARKFKPDMFVSRVSPLSGYASFLLRKPHVTCTDTENVKLLDSISEPFADVILTSESYLREHGKRQIRYPGTHELAYLHPNRFVPNPGVLDQLGIKPGEKFAVVRFVSWNAHHDIGHGGFSNENKLLLVDQLSRVLKVFISSESNLPPELAQYRIKIDPAEMHNVLNYASLFIGEGSTMAEESSVLGTPSILVTSCPRGGVIDDMERFHLMEFLSNSTDDQDKAIRMAVSYAKSDEIKKQYENSLSLMLGEFIDVSAFLAWFINEYPDSKKSIISGKTGFGAFR